MSTPSSLSICLATALLMLGGLLATPDAEAQRARGGGGHAAPAGGHAQARSSARTSVNRPATQNRSAGANTGTRNVNRSNTNVSNRNTNVNRNQNINVDRDVNVNVDVDDHNHWNDWDDHPFATAAAVTAGVAVTSAVIGSIVNTVPPSCVTTVVNGIAYQQCGSTWYQPQYAGTTVQYVVVNAP